MEKSLKEKSITISIRHIRELFDAEVIVGETRLDEVVEHVYISDMMSSILAYGKPNSILLTGVVARQSVISAHMAEFKGVVFLGGKKPQDASSQFAKENDLVLLSTPLGLYDACAKVSSILKDGCHPQMVEEVEEQVEPLLLEQEYSVMGGDFAKAGMVSTDVKSTLRKIGFDSNLIRRIAISTYEGEMNVVTHAEEGIVHLSVTPRQIEITIRDKGKGIPDIDLAMQEGYTTATPEIQAMGFGSGMGLPNIQKNSDDLILTSEVGKGTQLIIRFFV